MSHNITNLSMREEKNNQIFNVKINTNSNEDDKVEYRV